MEFIRRPIEARVLSLTGPPSAGGLREPAGRPRLFGPDSICWRVHGDFTSMMVGGISALLLQALHPLALAGVWDHSNFREDLLGRLRRTGQFISATTFGSHADAERLIERVRRIHLSVTGTAPDGRAYAAYDPELLTWVHVAEVSSFSSRTCVTATLTSAQPTRSLLRRSRADRRAPRRRRCATFAHRGRDVPRTPPSAAADRRARAGDSADTAHRPAPSPLLRPFGTLMLHAGIELLPEWASAMFGPPLSDTRRQLIRSGYAVRRRCCAGRCAVPRCTARAAAWACHHASSGCRAAFLARLRALLYRAARMPSPDQLRAAFDRRRPLLDQLHQQGTDCYRLFHGSREGAAGLTVDRYGPQLMVQSFHQTLAADALLRIHELAMDSLELPLQLVYNDRSQGNSRASTAATRRTSRTPPRWPIRSVMNGARLSRTRAPRRPDPLLFLDLRNARGWVKQHSAGKSVLNLFSYTCGVGLCAAAGGARMSGTSTSPSATSPWAGRMQR